MANLQLIKDIAERKNIPLASIASELGITPQALSKIMRNNSTKIETLEKIAHILRVSVTVFFEEAKCDIRSANAAENGLANTGDNVTLNKDSGNELLEKALDEISEHRKLIAQAQSDVSKLANAVLKLVPNDYNTRASLQSGVEPYSHSKTRPSYE